MKQRFVGFCYTVIKFSGLLSSCSFLLSRKLSYVSQYSFKEEFDNSYLKVTTIVKSLLLMNKEVGSLYIQSGYWESRSFDYCVLRSLWVHPLLKRNGVGYRLVSEIVNNAHNLGFKYIVLTCDVNNVAAQKLYEKSGFHKLEDDKEFPHFENERRYMQEVTNKPNFLYWMKLEN